MTDDVRREVLPIPDPQWVGLTTYDARDPDTTFPPITPVRPPPGAPNVLIMLLDDVGFGASSTFGGPCTTPTFDRLAEQGVGLFFSDEAEQIPGAIRKDHAMHLGIVLHFHQERVKGVFGRFLGEGGKRLFGREHILCASGFAELLGGG